MGLYRSLDIGGEGRGTQTVNYGRVCRGEGNSDVLAHLRVCGCRNGSWCGIPVKMIYWEVPLGKPYKKVRESEKGEWSTEFTVGN